jgi:hypothetical protein
MDVVLRTPQTTHFDSLPFRRSQSFDHPVAFGFVTLTRLFTPLLILLARIPTFVSHVLRAYFARLFPAPRDAWVLPPYQTIDGRTVFSWRDQQSDAVGWIVIDNPFPTVAGGGLFMHSGASLKEVTDVACAMS